MICFKCNKFNKEINGLQLDLIKGLFENLYRYQIIILTNRNKYTNCNIFTGINLSILDRMFFILV